MNILIVDDNKNNRMILRLLLEDYVEENEGVEFFLDEAEDGLIAVNKCKEKDYDVVLMDIMMPNMDGIEATKIIRQSNKKIMIIAVSAVDDSERQKQILNNGAEDYISKPVNADIFVSRIANYKTLIEARKHKISSSVSINLFTKNIFNRHLKFIINSEDALSEFWEYFLLGSEIKCENLSDVVRTIFSIAEKQRRLNIDSDVYVEESEDNKYFTLTNIDALPTGIIKLILNKNNFTGEYKVNEKKISFILIRPSISEEFEEPVIIEQVAPVKEMPIEEIISEEVVASPLDFSSSASLSVFDYMDEEDLHDLEEYASKLNSIMLIVGGGDVTEDEVVEIYTYLDRLGSILATYSEVYVISKALSQLSIDMSTYMNEFIKNSEALGPMCKAFSNDMTSWIDQSFHTGAPSVDFMNDTIVVNCQTITGMLKMDEAPADDGDFDDIFDF